MRKARFVKKRWLTREEVRAVDRYAIERLGIPGIVLMENAGRHAADLIERWLRVRTKATSSRGRVAILCGGGNNGGDGFVIARHLTHRSYTVSVDLTASPASLPPDAAANHAIIEKMGVPIRPLNDARALRRAVPRWRRSDVLVDALLGTGFCGEPREPVATIIHRANALDGPLKVAIDVPSGLDVNTGVARGPAVRADRTITFVAAKVGFSEGGARRYLGRVHVVDIGAPTEFILQQMRSTAED